MATLGLYFLKNTIICSGEVKPRGVARFAVILAVVLMNHGEVHSKVVQRPSDTTAIVNTSTYFNCSTSRSPVDERSITWFHFPSNGGRQRHDVYDDGRIMTNYKDRFAIEINLSAGTFNLLALRLEPEDAGRYECTDDILESQNASAELTVLDSDLVCESDMDPGEIIGPTQCDRTIAPDEVQLSCKVSYSGKIVPKMIWRKHGDLSNSNNTDCVIKDNSVTCNTTLTANLQLNEAVYICESTTQRYNCSLEMNKILYVFNGNARVNATIDGEVKCSANSSQSCSYKWEWFNGSDSVTVSSNQILKPTRVGSHRCEATCPIGNTPCVVNVMFVEVYSTQPLEATTGQYSSLLWILVVVVVPIIVAVIVVIYLRRKRAQEIFSASKTSETILTEQSLAPLIAVVDEDSKQVKQIDAEPIKETFGTIETDQSKSASTALKDEEEVKISHAEPNKCPKGLSVLEGKPEFVGAIKRREEDKGNIITGVTALKDEIFVASENSPVLEVFHAANNYALIGTVPIPEMVNPFDLASCVVIECVFIVDFKLGSEPKEIIRMKSSLKVEKRWSTGDDFGNLSVSSESNIILSVSGKNKLIEYTKDGEKFREITLPVTIRPRHAIKLTNGQFVISHGRKNDVLHQVCNVTMDGDVLKLVKSFGGEMGSSLQQLNEPDYLIVDEQGSILVLDFGNKRVLLLDSNLESKLEFLTTKTRLHSPDKMCLCKATCNLFIIDKVCNLLVFSIK